MTTTNHPMTLVRRRTALFAGALGLAVLPLGGTAGAQTAPIVLDPVCPVSAPPAPVADRNQAGAAHLANVDCVFALDIAAGTGGQPNLYRPAGTIRRDQMATLIIRTLEAAGYDVPAAGDQGFTDIDGDVHADNINRLAAIGVTSGTSSTTFSPAALVRRDQMATFLLRSAEWAFGTDLEGVAGQHFPDVPNGNVHSNNVNAAYELLGLVQGRGDGNYQPSAGTQRDQMATFMMRLVAVTAVD